MSGILIHDGRRVGHRKWCTEAIRTGNADGVILSPFSTPRVSGPRHPSALDVANDVSSAGGEVIFDAMTHARFLPGVDKIDLYNTWELWASTGIGLEAVPQQLDHIERVFQRQDQVGAPRLTPTLQLKSPESWEAYAALEMATIGKGLDVDCWQSLAGTRAFWGAGPALDAYVGSLVALHAPAWVLTMTNDLVVDHVPDMIDIDAFSGFCRTVHSLSLRSRVLVAHADYSGLPAVAAGADTIGSGWDRAQRTFDPNAFRVDSDPGIRIPASYVTQGQLHAILRRDTAEAIERWDATRARAIRGGTMPPSDQAQRMHHLKELRDVVNGIGDTASRFDRVDKLRSRYRRAVSEFDVLIAALPRIVREPDKQAWAVNPLNILESYAQAEGL